MIIYNKLPFLACKNILIIIYDLSNILEWYNTNFQMYIIKNIAAKTGY